MNPSEILNLFVEKNNKLLNCINLVQNCVIKEIHEVYKEFNYDFVEFDFKEKWNFLSEDKKFAFYLHNEKYEHINVGCKVAISFINELLKDFYYTETLTLACYIIENVCFIKNVYFGCDYYLKFDGSSFQLKKKLNEKLVSALYDFINNKYPVKINNDYKTIFR